MKLGLRFKKSLFAFFKDEILSSVGYNVHMQHVEIVTREMKITELRSEILLRSDDKYGEPIELVYEKSLEQAKRKLFEEAMKFIIVDESSIMDSHIYNHRAIRISLIIGHDKH